MKDKIQTILECVKINEVTIVLKELNDNLPSHLNEYKNIEGIMIGGRYLDIYTKDKTKSILIKDIKEAYSIDDRLYLEVII